MTIAYRSSSWRPYRRWMLLLAVVPLAGVLAVGCGGTRDKVAGKAASGSSFDFTITMTGIIGFVPKPTQTPTEAWALLANGTDLTKCPNCYDPNQAEPHIAALRFKYQYLGTPNPPDSLVIYNLRAEDIVLPADCTTPSPATGFSIVNRDAVPQMSAVAPNYAAACTNCAVDGGAADPAKLTARIHFTAGQLTFDDYTKDHSGNNMTWCFDPLNPSKQCPSQPIQKNLAQNATLKLSCTATPLVITLKDFTGANTTATIQLQPVGGKIDLDLVNLLPGDVLVPPTVHDVSSELLHFGWFYTLSTPIPVPNNFRHPYWITTSVPHDGKPYCSFAELTP